MPLYILTQLPSGVIGLALVALFASAMSSLNSVLNSLSATTMEEFVRPSFNKGWLRCHELASSRLITIVWGTLTLTMAFFVDDIAPTVLEAINKIGSLANRPILAVFSLGLLVRSSTGLSVSIGLLLGICSNALLWIFVPQVSWLWWNVSGFFIAGLISVIIATNFKRPQKIEALTEAAQTYPLNRAKYYSALRAVWCLVLLAILLWL